jgi:exonuclease SbcC
MHISKVELENIKSHVDSKFEFSRGTTAITGANGAGKTTIIEAIAWALFDVLDYKKDDFVRRGAIKGSVTLTFESSLDEREYIVYRDTMTAYSVYDSQLGARLADKREEVMRFLWQHMGLEPGTDLRALFKEAIGVPQGTLTAIFLGTPLERKSTFDRLLKVEEYRMAAEKLRETVRYVENNISAIDVRIARAQGELSRLDAIEDEHKSVTRQADELSSYVDFLTKGVTEKTDAVTALDMQESKVTELAAALERARSERERAQLICRQQQSDHRKAEEAAEQVAAVREKAERHIELLGRLKELERERQERDKLQTELTDVEKALVTVRADQKQTQDAFQEALAARTKIEPLKPKVADQERLEKLTDELRDKAATARALQDQLRILDERLERLRTSYKLNREKLREAEAKLEEAARVPEFEGRDGELVRQLAALRASLERDEKFQSEIKNGLCPVLSEKCLNLRNGQTLAGFVADQFTAIRQQIEELETEKTAVLGGLESARQAQKQTAAIDPLLTYGSDLVIEGKCLSDERQQLETKLGGLNGVEESLKKAEAELRVLDNPKGHIKLLEETASREEELQRELSLIEKNLERLESDREILLMRLESYKDIDAMIAESTAEREATEDAYRVFLANEALAKTLDEKEKLFEAARIAARDMELLLASVEKESAEAGAAYERERHLRERMALRELEQKLAEKRATCDAVLQRRDQLKTELDQLALLRDSLAGEFAEKKRLTTVSETTTFIRDVLREAAPRVARNYVHHVSLEAGQMFRDICGRNEQHLSWAEDYGILLEEGGYERPFGNLSGGEQTAAALSVRLAILKQLSDIRIAFFDEPTTNMDAERRENLAQQISQIKNFDQLFVISHDDTFEGYVDNVISI